MTVFRAADGDAITIRTNSQGIVVTSIERLTVQPDPPGAAAARGDVVAQSPVSDFEDIFHDDLQFDIEVNLASGGTKEYNGCMALSGSPKTLSWDCTSIGP